MPRTALLLYILALPVLYDSVERLFYVWGILTEEVGWLQQRYLDAPWLSTAHLLPGILFFLTGPLQTIPALRSRPLRFWHRLSGYIYSLSAIFSCFAIMVMVFTFPAVGGGLTIFGTYAICLALLLSLTLALWAIRRGDVKTHRLFMMASLTLGLTVATARWIIYGVNLVIPVEFTVAFAPASIAALAINGAIYSWVFRNDLKSFLAQTRLALRR
ncbi:DUF2306 domain-containing protein [Celeribacter ethanolicus]|uniref:DUF2306 domain-containing protein n=1 Tax=Celeribacter ethanolicus TaxID=1758178 RepID=UPI00082DFA1E|nr:DUF2306 domain-containing protein [Celeribacter ethanolicus]